MGGIFHKIFRNKTTSFEDESMTKKKEIVNASEEMDEPLIVMRDSLCKESDLRKTIDFNEETIPEDKEEIKQLLQDIKEGVQRYPRKPEEIIYDSKGSMFSTYYKMIRAKYSLGMDCKSLEMDYLDMLPYVVDVGSKKIGYVNFIEVFSLGILLEVSDAELDKLVRIADEEMLDDCLFDFLVQACGLNREYVSKGYQKENPYKETEKIIQFAKEDKKKAEKELETYMKEKWFQGHYDYEWKNAHKKYGYVGFWSFETGALAKIFDLDDAMLQDNNHYPYDLVHYKSEKKFITKCYTAEKKWEMEDCAEDDTIECMANKELEQIIPNQFRKMINQVIEDYKKLDDLFFWEKYNLSDIWYTVEMFMKENQNKELLGNIIVNLLVEEGYIVQLDYKEEPEDYMDEIKNFWLDVSTKLVQFDLNNDQYYYALIPKDSDVNSLYEVGIKNV